MAVITDITEDTKPDPNGKEAGVAFLEANKSKDGVIVLPSGLQYKVLEEGAGTHHPTASSPCECHYAGRLLDGTEFDNSYKRAKPSVFAPDQVIKGWTEAMSMMVVGDKWELCTLPAVPTHRVHTCNTHAHNHAPQCHTAHMRDVHAVPDAVRV